MTRWVAFLRAINVGGHTVKMDELRRIFSVAGLSSVETFIASGNVIFEAHSTGRKGMEARLEDILHEELGYPVDVFLRTAAEVAAIAVYRPFPAEMLDSAAALNIAFLAKPLDAPAAEKLQVLTSEIDYFHLHASEIYWLCLKKQSESTFSNAVLEKTLALRATMRGANTIRKLSEKLSSIM